MANSNSEVVCIFETIDNDGTHHGFSVRQAEKKPGENEYAMIHAESLHNNGASQYFDYPVAKVEMLTNKDFELSSAIGDTDIVVRFSGGPGRAKFYALFLKGRKSQAARLINVVPVSQDLKPSIIHLNQDKSSSETWKECALTSFFKNTTYIGEEPVNYISKMDVMIGMVIFFNRRNWMPPELIAQELSIQENGSFTFNFTVEEQPKYIRVFPGAAEDTLIIHEAVGGEAVGDFDGYRPVGIVTRCTTRKHVMYLKPLEQSIPHEKLRGFITAEGDIIISAYIDAGENCWISDGGPGLIVAEARSPVTLGVMSHPTKPAFSELKRGEDVSSVLNQQHVAQFVYGYYHLKNPNFEPARIPNEPDTGQ